MDDRLILPRIQMSPRPLRLVVAQAARSTLRTWPARVLIMRDVNTYLPLLALQLNAVHKPRLGEYQTHSSGFAVGRSRCQVMVESGLARPNRRNMLSSHALEGSAGLGIGTNAKNPQGFRGLAPGFDHYKPGIPTQKCNYSSPCSKQPHPIYLLLAHIRSATMNTGTTDATSFRRCSRQGPRSQREVRLLATAYNRQLRRKH
jgi:hypothetical protein